MTYAEKLKHPLWQRKRLEIFQRDGFACTKCRCNNRPLHVHHLRYFFGMDPWNIPNKFLCTLCERCHKLIHKNKKK